LIALALLLCAAPLRAAEPAVSLRVSTSAAALAQPVEIDAGAVLPPGAKLALDLDRTTTDYFSVAKTEALPFKDGSEGVKVTVLPLAIGRITIPLYWAVETAGSSVTIKEATPVVLDVADPLAQEKEAAPIDIKEPRAARPALWPWLLAALIGAALWELWRRRKTAAALEPAPLPVDNRPAEIIAFSELDELERSSLWGENRFKDFYLKLTDVLRHYLERRFGMPATRLTTAELYRQIREAELDRASVALFKDIFDRADLVKFAKIAPDPDWGGKDLGGARMLVTQTTPMPPAPAEAKK
jgi:hypothetical protein